METVGLPFRDVTLCVCAPFLFLFFILLDRFIIFCMNTVFFIGAFKSIMTARFILFFHVRRLYSFFIRVYIMLKQLKISFLTRGNGMSKQKIFI